MTKEQNAACEAIKKDLHAGANGTIIAALIAFMESPAGQALLAALLGLLVPKTPVPPKV